MPFLTAQDIDTFFGQVTTDGVACLFALYHLGPQSIEQLAGFCDIRDNRVMLRVLKKCDLHGYATPTGPLNQSHWHLTDKGTTLIATSSTQIQASGRQLPLSALVIDQPQANVDNCVDNSPDQVDNAARAPHTQPSDQSDQITDQSFDQKSDDQIDTDQSRAENTRAADLSLQAALDRYGIKEPARTAIKADPALTADHIHAAYQMAGERSNRPSPIGLTVHLLTFDTSKEVNRLQRDEMNRRAYAIAADRTDIEDLQRRAQKIAADTQIEAEAIERPNHVEPTKLKINPIVKQRKSGMCPEQVWTAALGELQLQMTKATFDTWVKQAQVIDFQGQVFQIAVANAYAQDWLQTRLASTVRRILTGICGRQVDVKFVAGEVEA